MSNATIISICREHGIHFAFAESCTGGKLAAAIVDVPGASAVFHGSFVTYSDGMKMEALGVDGYALGKLTAVSAEVAKQMALGALHNLHGSFARMEPGCTPPTCFTVSTTGYVGPFTTEERHAFIAIAGPHSVDVHEITFESEDRAVNQAAVIDRVLFEIASMLEGRKRRK